MFDTFIKQLRSHKSPRYLYSCYLNPNFLQQDLENNFLWVTPPNDILSDIYSGILSGIYSNILFGILSDIYFDILSGILSGMSSGPFVPRCFWSLRWGSGLCVPRLNSSSRWASGTCCELRVHWCPQSRRAGKGIEDTRQVGKNHQLVAINWSYPLLNVYITNCKITIING